MKSILFTSLLTSILALSIGLHLLASSAQSKDEDRQGFKLAEPGTRFEIEITESFDAKYLGDQPGHTGHGGGMGSTRPHVSLGDPVYRGDEVIGKVTLILWSHVKGSLTIEFDPEPLTRVAVGEIISVDLNPKSSQSR